MTSFPTPTRYRQRWQPFRNVGSEPIPPFAIIGPQPGESSKLRKIEALEGSDRRDAVLRLGRATAAKWSGQDAALFYANGPQSVSPGSFGNCTQDGPLQVLVGYPQGSQPEWNASLAIQLSSADRPASFALTPGSGGYRLVSFHGCPATSFRDDARADHEFRVAWVMPSFHESTPAGLIFRMGSGAAVVEGKSIVSFDSALGPQIESFGPPEQILSTDSQGPLDRAAGFFQLPVQGQYLLNFSAAIRSTDAPISGAYTLGLIARTGRHGSELSETLSRSQIESLREVLQEGSYYPDFHHRHQLLTATLGLQPADTNLFHDEVDGYITERTSQEVARHWFTVSGSTVLDVYAGDTFFFHNPTPYRIDIENFSGTLTRLPGAAYFATSHHPSGTSS